MFRTSKRPAGGLKTRQPDLISSAAKSCFLEDRPHWPGKEMASKPANDDSSAVASLRMAPGRRRRPVPGGGLAALLIDHQDLDAPKRRELLASWASDANAIAGRPSLRRIPGSNVVLPIDAILEALKSLDDEDRRRRSALARPEEIPAAAMAAPMPP